MSLEIATKDAFMVSMDKLNAYEEFSSFVHEEKEQILKFIQYAYNKESPYVKQYESLNDRLSSIAKHITINDENVYSLLALSGTKENYEEEECASDFLQAKIDDMISCYLSRIQNNLKFELYITRQLLFSEYLHRLRVKIPFDLDEDKALKAVETKNKILAPCEDLIRAIEKDRMDIFGDNLRHAKIADKKIAKSPEYFAKTMQNKG